jgi:ferrochelatase
MKYSTKAPHNHDTPPNKTGVLIVNLGTPEKLTYSAVRRYLKTFLSDPRVIELPPLLWRTLLNAVLLQIIPQKSMKNYAKIWDYEKDESPLLGITKSQAEKLTTEKKPVVWAMRYGPKFIEVGLQELRNKGCHTIKLLPLYPQYSATTTASVYDATFDALKKMRWVPTLQVIEPYYDNPHYIDALANSVKGVKFDALLCSYHGIPERYFKAGDPYPCHCMKTTRLLREKLGLAEDKVIMSYQSKFGKDKWMEPSTEQTLSELPSKGIKNLAVITPGFAADCIETLEEIAISGKETFLNAGGKSFTYIPCLNDSKDGTKMLQNIVE